MNDKKASESVAVANDRSKKTKNEVRSARTKKAFIKYLKEHPEERFWQAVRNFSGFLFVRVKDIDADGDTILDEDTFYWEGRDHNGE